VIAIKGKVLLKLKRKRLNSMWKNFGIKSGGNDLYKTKRSIIKQNKRDHFEKICASKH